jgi:hypothetical protein
VTNGVAPTIRNGKKWYEWVFKFGWGALVTVLMVAFYFGGRMETREVKQERCDRTVAPVVKQQDAITTILGAHVNLGGHPVMQARMNNVEARMNRLEGKTDEVLDGIDDIRMYLMTGTMPNSTIHREPPG